MEGKGEKNIVFKEIFFFLFMILTIITTTNPQPPPPFTQHHKIKVVTQCTDKLPKNKPRYLMGVGYAEDLVVCTALGVDMFDCVFPTRTARFGSALMDSGSLQVGKRTKKEKEKEREKE